MDQSGSEPQIAALARAEALVDASVGGSPTECLALANQIAELRRLNNTPAIAFAQATALMNATFDGDPSNIRPIVEELAALRRCHDSPKIAQRQARSLFNATVGADPRTRWDLVDEIAELRRCQDSPGIALEHSKALVNASTGPRTAGERCREFERAIELAWSAYEVRPTLRTWVELPLPAAWAAALRRIITDNTAHPDSVMLDRPPHPPSGS